MRTTGRPSTKKPRILEARPLTREDLLHLQPGKPRAQCGVVQRFRETHHRIARLLALGLRYEQIADITGYSLQRLYTIAPTPAMVELVAQYKDKVDARYIEEVDDVARTGLEIVKRGQRQMVEHLDQSDETGELLPLKTLITLVADQSDRFGYGKHTTQTNVNVDLAGRLERMKLRSGKANVIDAKVIPVQPPGKQMSLVQSSVMDGSSVNPSPTTPSRAELGAQLKSLATSMGLRRA